MLCEAIGHKVDSINEITEIIQHKEYDDLRTHLSPCNKMIGP